MPALSQDSNEFLKKQAVEGFNNKINQAVKTETLTADLGFKAKKDFYNAVNPGFFSRMGKYAKAFISPVFAPFRTEFAKKVGSGIGSLLKAATSGGNGGIVIGLLAGAAYVVGTAVAGIVGTIGAVVVTAVAPVVGAVLSVKGLYNIYQTAYNGADYHPLSGRTQENKDMSAALSSSNAQNTESAVLANYTKIGDDISDRYTAETTKLNQKNLVVTQPISHTVPAASDHGDYRPDTSRMKNITSPSPTHANSTQPGKTNTRPGLSG